MERAFFKHMALSFPKMYLTSVLVASAVIPLMFFLPRILWSLVLLITWLTAILLAVSVTITAHITLSMKHKVRLVPLVSSYSNFHKHILERYSIQVHKTPERLPVVFGRSIDFAVQDLLDLIVRDLISPWLQDLSYTFSNLQNLIK